MKYVNVIAVALFGSVAATGHVLLPSLSLSPLEGRMDVVVVLGGKPQPSQYDQSEYNIINSNSRVYLDLLEQQTAVVNAYGRVSQSVKGAKKDSTEYF